MPGLTGWHLLIIVAVIVLLFGAAKLPALAKSMGQSARVFKSEMKAMKTDDGVADASEKPAASEAPAAQPVATPAPVTAEVKPGTSSTSA